MSAPANPSDSLFDDDPEPAPLARAAPAGTVAPAWLDEELFRLGRQLPPSVHLGTSSWSFPGWQGIVYSLQHTEAQLARHGLAAYSQHPILRAVGIDRTFYQPLTVADYTRYTAQVPEHFRFLVKAPALVSDAVTRRERGAPADGNPHFLDPIAAREHFVLPALEGLGAHIHSSGKGVRGGTQGHRLRGIRQPVRWGCGRFRGCGGEDRVAYTPLHSCARQTSIVREPGILGPRGEGLRPSEKPEFLDDPRLESATAWLRQLDWFTPEPGVWINDANDTFLNLMGYSRSEVERRELLAAAGPDPVPGLGLLFRSTRGPISRITERGIFRRYLTTPLT